MSKSTSTPLEQLSAATGRVFPNILAARERTAAELPARHEKLEALSRGAGSSVVLMGSWGRAEVTDGSDDDFMLLLEGPEGTPEKPSIAEIARVLDTEPSEDGPFAEAVFSENLIEKIGLDEDDNKNLTRRLLFLLESTAVTGPETHAAVFDAVLARYLDDSVKPYRPPRFLLNDIVRYWRTICVDFAGKEHKGPEKWGLRNAKLRNSRKVLFAGGLLPVLECFRFDVGQMPAFLGAQLRMAPTDVIAAAFLQNDVADAGARSLAAYDEFIGHLNEPDFRAALKQVTRKTRHDSEEFAEASRLGEELEAGLLALLHEAPTELPKVVRSYAIF